MQEYLEIALATKNKSIKNENISKALGAVIAQNSTIYPILNGRIRHIWTSGSIRIVTLRP